MTQLQTDWLCIATSGATIDGRTIAAQDLLDMANEYNTAVYTALIWREHSRYSDNLGQVLALKAQQAGEKIKLFAKLKPTAQLVELNQQKQKLFTSIEIIPNFAQTGKAYLGGLAVTDSPASIGTTQLNFTVQGRTQQGDAFRTNETFKLSYNAVPTEIQRLHSAFQRLSFAEKSELFRQLLPLYQFSANSPSRAAFLAAEKAVHYQKFNRAV